MVKYKFVHVVEDCIGCGACASLLSKYWTMQGAKSKLIKADIEDKDLEDAKECRDACPVTCIKIKDETGKELKG